MVSAAPVILTIFGVSGDLARRKLLPAIDTLREAGKLPEKFELVGISRKEGEYFRMDPENIADYARLVEHLDAIEARWGESAQRLYYLAVPPAAAPAIVRHLGESGLLDIPDEGSVPRLLLEKPFGLDLASAEAHVQHVARYAREEQVYRVDHYLTKALGERVREAREGGAFKAEDISMIEIEASETIGIEGRAAFYEQVGVLGDVLQSHLMELLSLVLMEAPESPEEEPIARTAALAQLAPAEPARAWRGQYEGYREEVKNEGSGMPTAARIELRSSDPTWQGATIKLMAGKALSEKRTEVRITYHDGRALTLRAEPESVLGGYPQALLLAMAGEQERFASSGEVLASWHALDALAHAWRSGDDLNFYTKGASGYGA